MNLTVILLASLTGFAYLSLVRSYDKYEKEPFLKLLIVTVAGGTISVLISLGLYEFVEVDLNIADAILKVGMIEEFSKFIALIILLRYIRQDFNEIVDGIIYITAVSLGFSVIENIAYALGSEDPFVTLTLRSFFSVLGHISFSGYIGIALFIHLRVRKNYTGVLFSIILAALAHGFYDGFLFHTGLVLFFVFVFTGLLLLQMKLLKTVLGFSAFRVPLTEQLFTVSEVPLRGRCCSCNSIVEGMELRFRWISAGRCPSCSNFVFDTPNMLLLLSHFRPLLKGKRFMGSLPHDRGVVSLGDDDKVLYDGSNGFVSAGIVDLGNWLESGNSADKVRVLRMPVIGFIFRNLGIKYI